MSFKGMKAELLELLHQSDLLKIVWAKQCGSGDLSQVSEDLVRKAKSIKSLPYYYERWYSKAIAVVRQLVPDRLEDFVGCYKQPEKGRKGDIASAFRISEALKGKVVKQYGTIVADLGSCYSYFDAQCSILMSANDRIESSLYEIKQILQADLFDSEISAAGGLNEKGFARAAGAMAGVVLEKHLSTIAQMHGLTVKKKNPGINDFNQMLKDESILDVPTWRFIQRLGDIRNMCDHAKGPDPTKEIVGELIAGVDKVLKTVS